MASIPKAIPSVLAEHLEQLAMLWEQRENAQRSPDFLREDAAELDERLEAHVDGLLLAGDEANVLLEEGLKSDEAAGAFAAAYLLLRQKMQASADLVVDVFQEAQEGQLSGIRQALCHGPIKLIEKRLRDVCESKEPAVAAAALEVLAHHEKATGLLHRLLEHYSDENPAVRQAAWRITAMLPDTAL